MANNEEAMTPVSSWSVEEIKSLCEYVCTGPELQVVLLAGVSYEPMMMILWKSLANAPICRRAPYMPSGPLPPGQMSSDEGQSVRQVLYCRCISATQNIQHRLPIQHIFSECIRRSSSPFQHIK